jgi:hypothetical protein
MNTNSFFDDLPPIRRFGAMVDLVLADASDSAQSTPVSILGEQ